MTRPLLHLTPAGGWLNDPHGVTWHDGRYHLFHQAVPHATTWEPGCHWGHAVSDDLLTWERRPVALAPGDGDDGVWTGALVVDDDGEPWIFYTSVAAPDLGLGRVRVARAVDAGWDTWTKGEVVVEPPADRDLVAFRDPVVVREGDGWRMSVGASTRDGLAQVLTWTSPDLRTWHADGVALSRSSAETEPEWTGSLWECPQVLEIDGERVVLVSVWHDDVLHHVACALGDDPVVWHRLTFGASYYAPTVFRDRDGRPSLIAWMRGVEDPAAGWAGCLSIPSQLAVRDGRLVAAPHPVVVDARGAGLPAGEPAAAFDVEWTPAAGDRLVLAGDAVTAEVVVADGLVALERPGAETWTMPWDGEPLRVVVDGPVVEIASARGLLGGPVGVTTSWHTTGGRARAWSLAG